MTPSDDERKAAVHEAIDTAALQVTRVVTDGVEGLDDHLSRIGRAVQELHEKLDRLLP